MKSNAKILVVGSSGAMGSLIARELKRKASIGIALGDYDAGRGMRAARELSADFRLVDARDRRSLAAAVRGFDLVVVALNQEKPLVQEACADAGAKSLDIAASRGHLDRTRALFEGREGEPPLALMLAGFFPGLSGLLLRKAVEEFSAVDRVGVSLLQSRNAQAGASGIRDMLGIVSSRPAGSPRSAVFPLEKVAVPSRGATLPFGAVDHVEAAAARSFLPGAEIVYRTAWDSEPFTQLVALLARLGIVDRIVERGSPALLRAMAAHDPRKSENAAVVVEVEGTRAEGPARRTAWLDAFSDYGTTAKAAVALAMFSLRSNLSGVHFPFEIAGLDEVLQEIGDDRIRAGCAPSQGAAAPIA